MCGDQATSLSPSFCHVFVTRLWNRLLSTNPSMAQTRLNFVAGMLLLVAGVARADARPPDRPPVPSPNGWDVLVLLSDEALTPASTELLDGFREVWRQSGERVTIHTRHLDVARFAGPENNRALAKWLAGRYRETSIDAVVSVGRPAGAFLREYGSGIWPHARRVLAAVSEEWARGMPPEGDTVIATRPAVPSDGGRSSASVARHPAGLPDRRLDRQRSAIAPGRAGGSEHARQAARGPRARRPHLGRRPRAGRYAAAGLGGAGGRRSLPMPRAGRSSAATRTSTSPRPPIGRCSRRAARSPMPAWWADW